MTVTTSRPNSTSSSRRPGGTRPSGVRPVPARRVGYVVGAAVDGVLLYLTNVAPGWRAVPFLTDDFTRVLGLVNLSLLAGLVANLLYVMYDRRWFRDLGGVLTTGIGTAATVQLLRVFPFAFTDTSLDWERVARMLLVVGVVASAIGLAVQVALLVAHLVAPEKRN